MVTRVNDHFSLFNHYAHLGTYARILEFCVQPAHLSLRLLLLLLLLLRVLVITRLPPNNSFGVGTLILPRTDPPGLEPSKLNLETSKYIISRQEVYLWVIVPQKWANYRVRYVFGQSKAWWLVGCVFHLVLERTRVGVKTNRPCIPVFGYCPTTNARNGSILSREK